MRIVFNSEKREYVLDPSRVVEFVDELQQRFDAEAELRSENGKLVKPIGDLYIKDANGYNHIDVAKKIGTYTKVQDYFGKRLNVSTEIAKDGVLSGVNLGTIVMSKRGKRLTLSIDALEKLATNPEVVYLVAEKYAI